jgi:hypothetical protein
MIATNTMSFPDNRMPVPQEGAAPCVDTEVRYRHLIGNLSPHDEERFRMEHGRHFDGLDGVAGIEGLGRMADLGGDDAPEGEIGYELRPMERADDVYGSGIFDEQGRTPTVSPNLGVFAVDYSIPGYIGREVPFRPGEVRDWANNAEVVTIPGGGLLAVGTGGQIQARPVPRTDFPGGLTGSDSPSRAGTYVQVRRPYSGGVSVEGDVPQRPLYGRGRGRPVPAVPAQTRIRPNVPIVFPSFPSFPIPVSGTKPVPVGWVGRVPGGRPIATAVPFYPQGQPTTATATAMAAERRNQRTVGTSIFGQGTPFGAEPSTGPGIGTMLIAGGLVGAAAALLYGAMKSRSQ